MPEQEKDYVSIPYFVHEGDMARMSKGMDQLSESNKHLSASNKRLLIALIAVLVALVVNNACWLLFEHARQEREANAVEDTVDAPRSEVAQDSTDD